MSDINEATEALSSVRTIRMNEQGSPTKANYMSVEYEIEQSLTYLLKHRITKIQNDIEFEDRIKEAILDRLPEAEFSELTHILSMIQSNTNTAVEKVLLPFISKGERVPLLDNSKSASSQEAGEVAFNQAPKAVLDALAELAKLTSYLPKESSHTPSEAGASSTEEGSDS